MIPEVDEPEAPVNTELPDATSVDAPNNASPSSQEAPAVSDSSQDQASATEVKVPEPSLDGNTSSNNEGEAEANSEVTLAQQGTAEHAPLTANEGNGNGVYKLTNRQRNP